MFSQEGTTPQTFAKPVSEFVYWCEFVNCVKRAHATPWLKATMITALRTLWAPLVANALSLCSRLLTRPVRATDNAPKRVVTLHFGNQCCVVQLEAPVPHSSQLRHCHVLTCASLDNCIGS